MYDAVPVRVPEGYRIGPWEVREALASGAFATVYAARLVDEAPDLPRRAALKFLPTGTRTPRRLSHLRELAERETELLRRLRTPRLIRMYDTLSVDDPDHPELDGATVLVLERAERSLDAVPAPVPDAGAVLAQICEGLAQLHRAGWVHGDLKPANVLLMKDGSARLADFSTAAELEGTHAYTSAFVTPDYTAPELLWPEMDERGVQVRPSGDVWSFGVLAHTALTGTFPFPGATTEARCDAVTRYARGTEELRLSPELPDGWAEIIGDCLTRTHAERVGTEALLRRVEAAAGVARAPRPSRPRPSKSRPSKSRRPSWRQRHPVLAGSLATLLTVTAGLGAAAGIAHHRATQYDGTPVYEAVAVPTASASGYGYHRCPEDSVCFFSEHDGNGEMCHWQDSDPNWQEGEATCPWAAHGPVRSVFNNISDSRELGGVVYFRGADYRPAGFDRRRSAQRTGCSGVNSMGNLAGTYAPLSHKLVGSCTYNPSLWAVLSSLW
ncbi:protein kinase domain-containing protein [Streptomyces sp. TRM68416]|uniref:protein kinase domain-containing protein n=1 Tax=Streptomyces sp. TRM68416 TaxID=2758412 RepID=UPI001661AE88|nr:protein kinase [Streptomyces sp. TRM68416]MBD0839224.1 protein kinase [Streptomyces sp. TRM68416]